MPSRIDLQCRIQDRPGVLSGSGLSTRIVTTLDSSMVSEVIVPFSVSVPSFSRRELRKKQED